MNKNKKFLAISGFGTWGRGDTKEKAIEKMCRYDSRSKTSYHLYETDDATVEVNQGGYILTEPGCYLHKIEIKEKGKKAIPFDWAQSEKEALRKKLSAEKTLAAIRAKNNS